MSKFQFRKFFILAIIVLVDSREVLQGRRQKRYVGQFGDMIRYATDREALLYNYYGNHCGFVGHPEVQPLDGIDRCCYQHDRCYDEIRDAVCSSHWLGPSWVLYDWSWDASNRTLTCEDEEGSCDLATCSCDRRAAECFAGNQWHAEHKRRSGYDVFAEARFRAFQWFGTWFP